MQINEQMNLKIGHSKDLHLSFKKTFFGHLNCFLVIESLVDNAADMALPMSVVSI